MSGRSDRILDFSLRLLVWVACGLLFGMALFTLHYRERISTRALFISLALLPLGLHLLSKGTVIFVNLFGSGLATSLLATRGEPHSREYSEQQALIAAGRYGDAADSYRSHLVAFPDDIEAQLRLAALLAGPLDDPAAAESRYLEARKMGPNPRQETVIGNGLIDLHRKTGQRGRLKGELARFARIHDGTEAGAHARDLLRQIVEEEHLVT